MYRQVTALLRAEVNPLLEGEPGVGKTRFALALARHLGVRSYYVCLSHREGVEVHGNQVVRRETLLIGDREYVCVEQAPPRYVVEAVNEKAGAIIVFDELNRMAPQQAGPALAIFSEWFIGEVALPRERISLIACTNPIGADIGTWRLPSAMSSRFCKLQFRVVPSEWANNFTSYWGEPPVITKHGKTIDEQKWARCRAVVATFIRSMPEMLNKPPNDVRETQFPTPRTWDYLSRVLVTAEECGLTEDERHELFVGLVGPGAARQFDNWYRSMDLPDPAQLLDNPSILKLPVTADKLYYITQACAAECRRRKRLADEKEADKKLQESAVTAWLNAWAIFAAAVEAGCPRDIPTLVSHDLAMNRPRGARPPKEIDIFVDTAVAAGVKWDTTNGRRRK